MLAALAAVENPSLKAPPADPQWFAIMTNARMEFTAETGLRRLGYWTWLPYIRVKKTLKRANSNQKKIVTEDRAWLSSYIFIALRHQGESLGYVRDAYGVSTVVKSPMTGQPLQIPGRVMEALMARGDGTGFMGERDELSAPSRAKFKQGSQVTFKEGSPFEMLAAEVLSDTGGDEVRVVMDFFGAPREVGVKHEHIAVEDGAKPARAAA